MTWADWAIVGVLLACVLGGLLQGFFRTACSLIGLLFGLSLAGWNYGRIANLILPLVRIEAIADVIGFFVIALLVMALANLIGSFLGKALDWLGLGCLDTLGGGILGFFQGVIFVTLCLLVAVAFYPNAEWLRQSQLPRQFFGVLHISTRMTPDELAGRVREGLHQMEIESPTWMHSKGGGL